MCQFIETIQILDGKIQRLGYHQARMDATRKHFFGDVTPINLEQHIALPPVFEEIKCRIVYDKEIVDISYSPYHIRNIQWLKLVFDDQISYPYKSINRERLSELTLLKDSYDEILIVRNGLVTDTSYTNIALFDGHQWVTPASPLLKGTQRASLIDKGILHEMDIRAESLAKFQRICLINAMMDFGKLVIPVKNIK